MNIAQSKWFLILVSVALSPGLCVGLFLIRSDEMIEVFHSQMMVKEEIDPTGAHLLEDGRWDGWTDEISRLVDALRAERVRLDARGADLAELERRVEAERAELLSLRDGLERKRKNFSRMVSEIQEAEVRNLRDLARTYSTMSPAGAGRIFARMDDEMVVKILFYMKADAVAPILEEMAAAEDKGDRAALLSKRLRLMRDPAAANNGNNFR